jgi:2-succinyl-5-enolpyruvyl-6-hydroxy-3-cyclohexene-1-carboxylate synthase
MRVPNRTYVVPTLLADELAHAGVRHACVTPGSRSGPLAIAFASQPAVRVWTHLDERAAAFFALGLAKGTRAPVALVCTSGTAAANFLPAVVEAFHARVPLVVLTADRPPELRDCGAPQTIDQLRLFGPHARWFVEAALPETSAAGLRAARTLACRAVAIASGPPAGPVHVNVPLREPLAPEVVPDDALSDLAPELAAEGRGDGLWTRILAAKRSPGSAAIGAIAPLLATARRPLVVCGPLDDPDPELPARVATLAHRLGAPVLAEPASNLRRPALDDVLVDAQDALLREPGFRDAHRPDVVLRLGTLPTSKTLVSWLGDHPEVPQIVLDGEGGWSDPAGVVLAVAAGAPAATLTGLLDLLPAADADLRWLWRWRRAGAAARAALCRALEDGGAPFEGHAVAALAAALPARATLYAGNSLAIRDLDWFWPAGAPPVRVLANRGANGIDGFVSSVLGAAAGLPGPTLGLCGDLSFLHDLGGLLAARRHRIRATFVVLDNDGGGIFDHLPIAAFPAHHEELFVTPHGLDLGPLVRAYGAGYRRVRDAAVLAEAIESALEAPETTVVHLPFERASSLAAHRRAWASATAQLGYPR